VLLEGMQRILRDNDVEEKDLLLILHNVSSPDPCGIDAFFTCINTWGAPAKLLAPLLTPVWVGHTGLQKWILHTNVMDRCIISIILAVKRIDVSLHPP
jgi:hypothetical protein